MENLDINSFSVNAINRICMKLKSYCYFYQKCS